MVHYPQPSIAGGNVLETRIARIFQSNCGILPTFFNVRVEKGSSNWKAPLEWKPFLAIPIRNQELCLFRVLTLKWETLFFGSHSISPTTNPLQPGHDPALENWIQFNSRRKHVNWECAREIQNKANKILQLGWKYSLYMASSCRRTLRTEHTESRHFLKLNRNHITKVNANVIGIEIRTVNQESRCQQIGATRIVYACPLPNASDSERNECELRN